MSGVFGYRMFSWVIILAQKSIYALFSYLYFVFCNKHRKQLHICLAITGKFMASVYNLAAYLTGYPAFSLARYPA